MNRFWFRVIVPGLAVILVVGAGEVLACMCPYAPGPVEDQVLGELAGSSAVFTGKVTGFEYRKGILFEMPGVTRDSNSASEEQETQVIRFEVERWWKMPLAREILLITSSTRPIRVDGDLNLLPQGMIFSGCSRPFIKGETYLVYASGPADRLQYQLCSRSASLAKAADDLKVLGKGRKPVTNIRPEN